jgi:nitrate/TMAO reductase-like tetraheme cytochrome c subunit
MKLLSVLTLGMVMLASCEGPMGPAGPAGADGTNGIDGVDANATCTECHTNDQVIEAKMAQWSASTHATGGNSERNTAECAPCHTSQGFLEANADGAFTTLPGLISVSGTIANPNQQNCYTCHDIHNSYTSDDWALTKTAATVASHSIDGSVVSVDLGKANMCTGCHQGRALAEELDMTDNTTEITPSSYRYGIHHGPQYNVFIGEGFYEFEGSESYPTGTNHMMTNTDDACVTCHMNTAYGTQAGGHTMNVAYDYHGNTVPNLPASCKECHIDKTAMDLGVKMAALQTDIEEELVALGAALEAAGVKKVGADYIDYTGSSTVLPQTEMMLAAFVNYDAFEQDRSLGMHNPFYARALLVNTTEAVIANTPAAK